MLQVFSELRFTGLRARLLGIVLIAVVPMAILLFAYAGYANQAALSRAQADVRSKLGSDLRSIQDLVSQGQATLETFGITYAIQAQSWDLVQGNANRLQALHPEYTAISVSDSSGRIRASSPTRSVGSSVSRDELFKRAVDSGKLTISGYVTDPLTSRPAVRIALPVYGPRDNLIAVEFISYSPATFRGQLNPASSTGVELLLDGRGTVVARQPALPSIEGRRLPQSDLVHTVLSEKRGSATLKGLDGVLRTYYFAPVFTGSGNTQYLVTGFSAAELFAEQRRAFTITVVGFAAFAILALVAAWLVGTYSIYRPALLLRRAAERLSQGDLTARADFEDRQDEFGLLRTEFNEMAEALQTQVSQLESTRSQLHSLNTDLEERVARRTAELEASNKELEAFSYSVSHDLRSPLRAIDGFSLALLEDYWDLLDDEGRDDLRRVRDNATRMGDLIDSLLRLSRLSRQEMQIADVDLTELANEAATGVVGDDPDRDVTFEIQRDVHGRGDRELLRVVLDNLLSNAWKFTGQHSSAKIGFGVREIEGETVYFVSDDGAGFDMAYAGKLFGAFQRIHSQKEFPGIGIGLATTARIVRRHGGRIWAEGEPEKGATFFFTLC